MTGILHKLYSGKIIPCEMKNINAEKQLEVLQKIETEQKYFSEMLSAKDNEKIEKLMQLHCDLIKQEEENIFSYGFTLGLLLMADISHHARLITGE